VVTPILACVVCARPLDSLLTSGLQAGVTVLAVVALAVIGGLARGVIAVVRADARLASSEGAPAQESQS
jgi:hypothetical protein